jgi:hypothetical protein
MLKGSIKHFWKKPARDRKIPLIHLGIIPLNYFDQIFIDLFDFSLCRYRNRDGIKKTKQ